MKVKNKMTKKLNKIINHLMILVEEYLTVSSSWIPTRRKSPKRLACFRICNETINMLTVSTDPQNDAFFKSLTRLWKITE